jgi:hypothetical protein
VALSCITRHVSCLTRTRPSSLHVYSLLVTVYSSKERSPLQIRKSMLVSSSSLQVSGRSGYQQDRLPVPFCEPSKVPASHSRGIGRFLGLPCRMHCLRARIDVSKMKARDNLDLSLVSSWIPFCLVSSGSQLLEFTSSELWHLLELWGDKPQAFSRFQLVPIVQGDRVVGTLLGAGDEIFIRCESLNSLCNDRTKPMLF